MNQRELNSMSLSELGAKYWKLIDLSKKHPQRNLRANAKCTARIVLDEFQLRLIAGESACIDDFNCI